MCQKEPLGLEKKGTNKAKARKGSNERNKPVRRKQTEFGLPRSSYSISSMYIETNSFERTGFCLSVFAYKGSYSMAQIMSEC